jgi:hypothetical protein
MSTFVEFENADIKTDRDFLEQLTDILQNDISGSATRRKSQLWITESATGPGVTSSLYQTVFDQDFTLQTANAYMDITFGLAKDSLLVRSGSFLYEDTTTGKLYFTSQSLQMREKISLYKQFAQDLLGDSNGLFQTVSGSTSYTIREPLFITVKRLFTRDRMKRESFGIALFQTSSGVMVSGGSVPKIYTDVGSNTNVESSNGGEVSTLVDSSNVNVPVGLLYLDKGIVVLDTQKVFDPTNIQFSGSIKAVSTSGFTPFSGSLNKLFVSGCIDDIIDHLAVSRFNSGSDTAIVFQNQTIINSTLFFCNLRPSDFNYSSNPTYTDENGRIVVIESGQEDRQKPFTFVTGIGLYDANNNLMAIAKAGRPLLKDPSRAPVIRVRLDH